MQRALGLSLGQSAHVLNTGARREAGRARESGSEGEGRGQGRGLLPYEHAGATICLRGHTCPNVWPLPPLLLLNP